MELRQYQREAIDAVFDHYRTSKEQPNIIISIPTGAGKSLIQAEILKRSLQTKPDLKFLCLAHVKELLDQNESELLNIWPEAPVGVVSAGLSRSEYDKSITIAGIQTIYDKIISHIDVMIIDEVHRFSDDPTSMYMQLYMRLKDKNPNLKMIGMTATPFRTKKGLMTKSEVWDKIVYSVNIKDMIKDGYLCKVVTKQSETQPDLKGVRQQASDYIMSEAATVMDKIHDMAIDEIIRESVDRQHWLIFACNVEHAFNVRYSLEQKGIPTAVIVGDMSDTLRDDIISDFKCGFYRALVNVNILTTGFNFKSIDLIVTLRPTKSAIIYVQSIGRGMRIEALKRDCLVLDFAGWVDEFGPIDQVKISPRSGIGNAPHKTCKICRAVTAASARVCPECGSEFERKEQEVRHNATSSQGAILSGDPVEYNVQSVFYSKHKKPDKLPSLKVHYLCGGFFSVYEWIFFEHEGMPLRKAKKWWKRFGKGEMPVTIDEALRRTGEISLPNKITVVKEGKWDRVVWD